MLSINNELNTKYQKYLEDINNNGKIFDKFGENLHLIVIRDIHPNVDFDYVNQPVKVDFNNEELKRNRLFKNAFNISIRYRENYIDRIHGQKEEA